MQRFKSISNARKLGGGQDVQCNDKKVKKRPVWMAVQKGLLEKIYSSSVYHERGILKMESIEKYNVLRVKKIAATKEEEIMHIEEEMYYILEENRGLSKAVEGGKLAEERLQENRRKLDELMADMAMLKGGQADERL